MSLSGLTTIAWICVIPAALACGGRARPPVSGVFPDSTQVRTALHRAMARSAPALGKAIAEQSPSAIRVRREPSVALPGVVYHWGVLVPDRGQLHTVDALVAEAGDSLVVLRGPDDFTALLALVPRAEEADATRLCEEAVRTTSERRTHTWPPVMYVDSLTPARLTLMGRREALSALAAPRRAPGPDSESVDAWFFEPGRTVRYTCVVERRPLRVRYSPVEVVRDIGLPRLDS